jgi:hypothetical protein
VVIKSPTSIFAVSSSSSSCKILSLTSAAPSILSRNSDDKLFNNCAKAESSPAKALAIIS